MFLRFLLACLESTLLKCTLDLLPGILHNASGVQIDLFILHDGNSQLCVSSGNYLIYKFLDICCLIRFHSAHTSITIQQQIEGKPMHISRTIFLELFFFTVFNSLILLCKFKSIQPLQILPSLPPELPPCTMESNSFQKPEISI